MTIRRLLSRFLPGKHKPASPRIYGPADHPIRRAQLSRGALEVTRKLQEAGFKAFVVGGAVRDLLLGIEPKDFDIATDARPEQVKPLFRRAFIIGRRFRLVHVHVGPEPIEVSTFRAAQTGEDATDEHGRLISDNVYGTQGEDAARRDFTINALYFDPSTEEVWDYVGGVADIRLRRLKLIGPPVTRLREDPVRMLRAVRLAAKLGVAIDPKTAAPIPKLASLIQNVPPARLFDEMQKLLLSGHAVETLKSLRAHGLSHGLLPLIDVVLEQPLGQRFIEIALADTDLRVREDRGVSPGIPVRDAALARSARDVERREGRRRQADPRALRRDGRGAGKAGEEDRRAAPLRGRDQGDLVAAAAFRAALGTAAVSAHRARAIPRGMGFSRAALQERRARRRARRTRRLVGPLRQRGARSARSDAETRYRAQEASARALPRAQAPPRGRNRAARAQSGRASRVSEQRRSREARRARLRATEVARRVDRADPVKNGACQERRE